MICCVLILDPSSYRRKLGKSSDCNGHCKESLCCEFLLNKDGTNFFHNYIVCMEPVAQNVLCKTHN